MEENKFKEIKMDSNDLNIDASNETNEIQNNIPKNKCKKKTIILIILILLAIFILIGVIIIYLSHSNDSSDSDSINSLDCTDCINSLILSDSSDSEIKSLEEGKIVDKEKVEEKIKIA